jgi:hypothetical protein
MTRRKTVFVPGVGHVREEVVAPAPDDGQRTKGRLQIRFALETSKRRCHPEGIDITSQGMTQAAA